MKIALLLTLVLLLGLVTGNVSAQEKTICDSTTVLPYDDSLDSLLGQWHNYSVELSEFVPDTIIYDVNELNASVSDSVLIQRLSELVSPFPFPYNDKVKGYIDLYTRRKREQVERMLGLSEYYFPFFEAALDAKNLPLELKYLPIIESALNPVARSRVGASGLWQFMLYTGKRYGLEINSYVDERLDVAKSTEAAVNFLSDLYNIYGDWHLSIAAYNCGPGNVNKAIRRAGGKKDFWQIYYYLPKETRGYVPAFIAAAYAMNYYRDHNLYPKPAFMPVATDTIMVSKMLHFEQISTVLGISVTQLRELNPHYRRDVIPGGTKSYPLRLPFEHAMMFASYEDSIYTTNRSKYFNNEQPVVNIASMGAAGDIPHNATKLYHTVKSGDTPGGIASKYRVSLADLKSWNHINRNMIRVGQRLVVYVPKSRAEQLQTTAQGATSAKTQAQDVVSTSGDYVYYTVRSGDNLWTIANKFPGVSNSDIMALNNLSNNKLMVGQILKIKPKS